MSDTTTKHSLRSAIDEWVSDAQEDGDKLNMWISATLIDSVTDAAWAVLHESRKTQQWLRSEGMMKE